MQLNHQSPGELDVSVVVPARDEETTIAEVVRRVDAALDARGWSHEIILGDSASNDRTVSAALGTGLPIRVIATSEPGKGRILTRALLAAEGRVLAFIDADLDLSPEELPDLVDEVRAGAACAVGVKRATNGSRRPLLRRVASRVVNTAARVMLRTGLTDHQTGMKAFSRDLLHRVLPDVVETGWLWDTEVLWRLRRAGGTAVEVPVTLLDARGSSFRGVEGLHGAREFIGLYRRVALVAGGAGAEASAVSGEGDRGRAWGLGRFQPK